MRPHILAALMVGLTPATKPCDHCRALPGERHGFYCPTTGWRCVPIDQLQDPEPQAKS